MSIHHLRLEWLQQFLVLAQWQNFRLAAQHLHISQQALSKNLAALEKCLGVTLVERHQRFQSLTPAGERLKTLSPALLDDWNRLQNIEAAAAEDPILTIGSSVFWSRFLLPQALLLFHRTYPHVRLHLQHIPAAELEDALLRQDIQLALGVHFMDRRIHTRLIAHAHQKAIVPADCPATNTEWPFIRIGKLQHGHLVTTNWDSETPRHFKTESNNFHWMMAFSHYSQMAINLPDCLIPEELATGQWKDLPGFPPPPPIPLHAAWLNPLIPTSPAMGLLKAIKKVARHHAHP